MRRSASSSSSRGSGLAQDAQNGRKSSAPASSSSNSSDPHADESSENHRDRDREDDERGRHGWGAGEEPVAPHLAKAITARWFAADLGNTTAAAAVYNEVGPGVPQCVI